VQQTLCQNIVKKHIKNPGILKHIKSSWAFCGISLKKLYMTLGEMEKFLSIFGLFFGEIFKFLENTQNHSLHYHPKPYSL
jgi:hypothetical protein